MQRIYPPPRRGILHIPKGIRVVTHSPTSKRALAVSDDTDLLHTRVLLLESQGYMVEGVASHNEAMSLLLTTDFDLVLFGRNSSLFGSHLDERIRSKCFVLKVRSCTEASSTLKPRCQQSVPTRRSIL